MKVVNINKILVMGIIGLILVNFSTLIYHKYTDEETNIPKVKLKDQEEKKDTFAIMLEQDDGTYQATESTSFNQPGYTFNSEKSGCIDINGNKIDNVLSYDETTKAVGVTSNKTIYCYVYFDKMPTDPNELITTLANADEIAYDGTADNNLRYIGADPNNYIYFNCSNYNNPTADTCEKWRIIGAFNNVKTATGETKTLLKIIRSESLGKYSWDYKQRGVGTSITENINGHFGGSNDWGDSQLMLMLNGVSLGNYKSGYTVTGNYLRDTRSNTIMNISGSYYEGSSVTYTPTKTTTSGYSSTATVDFSSTGLKNDTTRGIIENVVWKLGGTSNYESNSNGLASHFYSYERGTKVASGRPTEWTGKIGLMYLSDYGYATSGGSTTNRETCLAKELHNWYDLSDCFNNDWLYNVPFEWVITPCNSSQYADEVFFIAGSTFVSQYWSGGVYVSVANAVHAVRPSVFLTSNIGISGGDGSSTSPYTLKVSTN